MDKKHWGNTTKAIHGGSGDHKSLAITMPIFQTSTFRLEDSATGSHLAQAIEPAQFYTRWGNPNFSEVEAALALLEGADRALVASSGMGAIATILEAFLRPGDHVVAPNAIYLGTEQLLKRMERTKGIRVTWIRNTLDITEWENAIRPETALLWVETPSNPTLSITDLAALAALGKNKGIRTVADNTFATPILTKPCQLGFHLSVSSATKYLGGHGDIVMGVIAGAEADVVACWEVAKLFGPTPDPFAVWLLQRGLKTLHLRVRRHSDNAGSLSQWLLWHPSVIRVDYPGLPDHAGHDTAMKQMNGLGGGMLSFELRGGLEAGQRFCRALKLITPGVSLGSVESLIQHPASTTHLHTPLNVKGALGISDGLLRFSVGIEDEADIKEDLERGLQAAQP